MLVGRSRSQDIELRGKYTIVTDYDGSPIPLENAQIWYNNNGKYVEPKDYYETHAQDTDSCCFNLFGIFNQDDML